MPFASEKQRRWMHANHPEMAKRWEAHGGKKNPIRETALKSRRNKKKDRK